MYIPISSNFITLFIVYVYCKPPKAYFPILFEWLETLHLKHNVWLLIPFSNSVYACVVTYHFYHWAWNKLYFFLHFVNVEFGCEVNRLRIVVVVRFALQRLGSKYFHLVFTHRTERKVCALLYHSVNSSVCLIFGALIHGEIFHRMHTQKLVCLKRGNNRKVRKKFEHIQPNKRIAATKTAFNKILLILYAVSIFFLFVVVECRRCLVPCETEKCRVSNLNGIDVCHFLFVRSPKDWRIKIFVSRRRCKGTMRLNVLEAKNRQLGE